MANTESHAERALALKSARKIFADTDCTEEYGQLVRSGDRVDLCEICCSPNSILSEVCLGLGGKAFRINLANGCLLAMASKMLKRGYVDLGQKKLGLVYLVHFGVRCRT